MTTQQLIKKLEKLNIEYTFSNWGNDSYRFTINGHYCKAVKDSREDKLSQFSIYKGYNEINQEGYNLFFNTFISMYKYATNNKAKLYVGCE